MAALPAEAICRSPFARRRVLDRQRCHLGGSVHQQQGRDGRARAVRRRWIRPSMGRWATPTPIATMDSPIATMMISPCTFGEIAGSASAPVPSGQRRPRSSHRPAHRPHSRSLHRPSARRWRRTMPRVIDGVRRVSSSATAGHPPLTNQDASKVEMTRSEVADRERHGAGRLHRVDLRTPRNGRAPGERRRGRARHHHPDDALVGFRRVAGPAWPRPCPPQDPRTSAARSVLHRRLLRQQIKSPR